MGPADLGRFINKFMTLEGPLRFFSSVVLLFLVSRKRGYYMIM